MLQNSHKEGSQLKTKSETKHKKKKEKWKPKALPKGIAKQNRNYNSAGEAKQKANKEEIWTTKER